MAIKNAAANNKGKSAKRNEKKQEKKKEDAVAGTVDKLQKLRCVEANGGRSCANKILF